jgi:hypothetical protein
MKLFKSIATHVGYVGSTKLVMAGIFMLALGVTVITTSASNQKSVQAASCSANDIIDCGITSASNFVTKYKANATKDLAAIYAHYGLSAAQIDQFSRTAVEGTVCKDGTVSVNGKVVASGARSLGRSNKSGDKAITIGGKTYYEGTTQNTFASNCLPSLVFMNGNQFIMAIIKDCANPVVATANAKPPTYACNSLTVQSLNRADRKLTVNATATGGAKIAYYIYEFGDGAKQQTTATSVNHTYKDGSFTAKVTVYVTVNGATAASTSAACAKPVTVTPAPVPAANCTGLTIAKLSRTSFRLDASAQTANGATVVTDAKNKQVAAPSVASTALKASTTVNVTTAGSYKAQVTVTTSLGDKTSAQCAKSFTVTPETCIDNPKLPACQPKECLPGIPEGDARCTPVKECQPGIPVGDERCNPKPPVTPPSIPSTGPVDMLSGVFGIGSLAGAGHYWYRSRRNLFMK